MTGTRHVTKPACWVPTVLLTALLAGCGGSNGGSRQSPPPPPPPPPPLPVIETGRFLDAAVSGIDYRSGATAGTTGGDGSFQYEIVNGAPQSVAFSFAGIEIGSALGRAIVTPLDLVAGSDLGNAEVVNISRFLQLLDSDADLANGIEPSAELLAAVAGQTFEQIDFSDPDFANQAALTALISFLNSVDATAYVLPSPAEAIAHLRGSLACISSGVFAGRFAGDDTGHFVMLVQHLRVDPFVFGDSTPRAGVASALIYSEPQDRLIGVLPQESLAFDSAKGFIVGSALNGAEFTGVLEDYQRITNGNWRNDVEGGSGTFSGERVAGSDGATFRLAGGFGDDTPLNPADDTADNRGGITLDVFADNSVDGVLITTRGNRFDLAGSLDGETISVTSTDGATVTATFDRDGSNPLSDSVGLFGVPGFWGTWQTPVESGGVAGTGCLLP